MDPDIPVEDQTGNRGKQTVEGPKSPYSCSLSFNWIWDSSASTFLSDGQEPTYVG